MITIYFLEFTYNFNTFILDTLKMINNLNYNINNIHYTELNQLFYAYSTRAVTFSNDQNQDDFE